jgi:hypothetical protein
MLNRRQRRGPVWRPPDQFGRPFALPVNISISAALVLWITAISLAAPYTVTSPPLDSVRAELALDLKASAAAILLVLVRLDPRK